jgi:hypothetical protein
MKDDGAGKKGRAGGRLHTGMTPADGQKHRMLSDERGGTRNA